MAKLDSAWGRMETSITTTTMSMFYLIIVHVYAHAHIHCVQQMFKLLCGICKHMFHKLFMSLLSLF